jgi:hypothetical protein
MNNLKQNIMSGNSINSVSLTGGGKFLVKDTSIGRFKANEKDVR